MPVETRDDLKSFHKFVGEQLITGGDDLAAEADHFDESLRQVLFKTRRGRAYRALFVIRGRVVHVLCHSRKPRLGTVAGRRACANRISHALHARFARCIVCE